MRASTACSQAVSQSGGGGGQRTECWRAFTLPRIDHEAAALIILYNKSQSIWH